MEQSSGAQHGGSENDTPSGRYTRNRSQPIGPTGQTPTLGSILWQSCDPAGKSVPGHRVCPAWKPGCDQRTVRGGYCSTGHPPSTLDDDHCHHCVLWQVVAVIAAQVCDGMLALEASGIVHRDLAARNILLRSFDTCIPSRISVCIADFGLAVPDDYYGGGKAIPVRWVPPEVLRRRRFSSKSDVWAFCVTLWEVLCLI